MPAVRRLSVVLSLLAISLPACALSACASASGANGPGHDTHMPAYQRGYHVGREARLRYRARPESDVQDLMAFCLQTAYLDIQPMKGALVPWSEGFDAGCLSRLLDGCL
jgi:hypothetical protein